MNRTIDIVIEALVLEGFDPADREAIASAAATELSSLFEGHAVLQATDIQRLFAQPVHLTSPREPRAIGEGIARAVHAALPYSHSTGTAS